MRPPRQNIACTIPPVGAGIARTRAARAPLICPERLRCARTVVYPGTPSRRHGQRHPACVTYQKLRTCPMADVCGARIRQGRSGGRIDAQHVRDHGDHARGRQVVQPCYHAHRADRATAAPLPPTAGSPPHRRRDTHPPATNPRSAPRRAPHRRRRAVCARPTASHRGTRPPAGCARRAPITCAALRCARAWAVSGSPASGEHLQQQPNSGGAAARSLRSARPLPYSVTTSASVSSGSANNADTAPVKFPLRHHTLDPPV